MPAIPLGLNAFKRSDGLVPEARLLNMVTEKDGSGLSPDGVSRIQRPGSLSLYGLGYDVRGMNYRAETGETLTVAGGNLFSGQENKGAITGSDTAAMVDTTFAHAIASGGNVYLYNDSVTQVAIPDGYAAQDVDQLNQYVLVLTPSGRFYWIVPGETTIDPLNFATAESSPDKARAIRRIGDEFAIFSDDSVEFWQATGDLDAPFQKVTGRSYERGCTDRDSVRRFDNALIWVDADGQVCRSGAVPQVVSDNGIAERLRKRSGECVAWVFSQDGHEYYVLDIPGQGTFVYDALTSSWSEWASPDQSGWIMRFGYDYRGEVYAGGDTTVFGVSAEYATDNGVPFERLATATVPLTGKTPRNDSLSIGVGVSEDTTIRIRWRDGQDDYPDHYEEMDVRAPFDVVNLYRLGMPLQPYREFEWSCVTDSKVRLSGAVANESWR